MSFATFQLPADSKVPIIKWREASEFGYDRFDYMPFNYGIDCGKSGIWVIDIDQHGIDGEAEFRKLFDWPETYTVTTPSGGKHLYFRMPDPPLPNQARLPWGETRGAGGFVVGPGSTIDGKFYSDNGLGITEPPQKLVEYCRAIREQPVKVTSDGVSYTGSWTDPDIDILCNKGIPDDMPQDDVLRDVALKLCRNNVPKNIAHTIWKEIVSKSTLKRPNQPWTEWDFMRHWNSAVKTSREVDDVDTLVEEMALKDEAQRRFKARKNRWHLVEPINGSQLDPKPEQYLVESLIPWGGNVIFSGYQKSGKSTLLANLIKSLLHGDKFLCYPVVQTGLRIAYANFELTDTEIVFQYLPEDQVRNHKRLRFFQYRGRVHCFDLDDPQHFDQIASQLKAFRTDVLILDPLSAMMVANGRDPNQARDMLPMLYRIDELKDAAGIGTTIVALQTGHGDKSRAAGSYAVGGWADVIWNIKLRISDHFNSNRNFSAIGRGVNEHLELAFDHDEKQLQIAGNGNGIRFRSHM